MPPPRKAAINQAAQILHACSLYSLTEHVNNDRFGIYIRANSDLGRLQLKASYSVRLRGSTSHAFQSRPV